MNRRKFFACAAFPLTFLFSLLLIYGVNIYTHRQGVFNEAAMDGNLLWMKVTLAMGADVHSPACPYRNCYTPIFAAAWGGNNDAVRFLLDRGADVNARPRSGRTALMVAAHSGHVETVKLLLARGADVNAECNGDTALTIAKEREEFAIVELLRQAGAKDNPTISD